MMEPFGYFKCEPCGWTDCAGTDDGAVPLYERATVMELKKQRDALLVALEDMVAIHDQPSGFAGKFGKALSDAIDAQAIKINYALSIARAAIRKVRSKEWQTNK